MLLFGFYMQIYVQIAIESLKAIQPLYIYHHLYPGKILQLNHIRHSTYGGGWKLKKFMYKQKMLKNDSTITKCNCYNHENLHKKLPTARNWQTIEWKRETTSSRTQCVATNQRILLVRFTFFSSSAKTELKLNVEYSTGSHECNVTQSHSIRIDRRQNASDSCRVTSHE